MSSRSCEHCGGPLSDTAKFCRACGIRVSEARADDATTGRPRGDAATCRWCGRVNPVGSKFCRSCGKRLMPGDPAPDIDALGSDPPTASAPAPIPVSAAPDFPTVSHQPTAPPDMARRQPERQQRPETTGSPLTPAPAQRGRMRRRAAAGFAGVAVVAAIASAAVVLERAHHGSGRHHEVVRVAATGAPGGAAGAAAATPSTAVATTGVPTTTSATMDAPTTQTTTTGSSSTATATDTVDATDTVGTGDTTTAPTTAGTTTASADAAAVGSDVAPYSQGQFNAGPLSDLALKVTTDNGDAATREWTGGPGGAVEERVDMSGASSLTPAQMAAPQLKSHATQRGYQLVSAGPGSLSGHPSSFQWVFTYQGNTYVDWFFEQCNHSFAALGVSPSGSYGSYSPVFTDFANSVQASC